ncbi:DNA-3-methyladenine glycosylase I [Iodidimonas sp. SYSU 1G8]|uniref:DNA-3-methyladenine glycosylase I n=1 Tax=Iodidimonas sp. SYSU 1G8 TaxID=3133967 RepID=UPI0031FEB7AD
MTDLTRCAWPGTDPLYVAYHDEEWGVPERDSRALYEKLMLDGFQAGLSWITILRKRENFRAAFQGFQPEIVATFGPADVDRLLGDAGIIRHRGKIEGAIASAKAYLAMEERGESFSDYLWQFTGGRVIQNSWSDMKQVPTETPESRAMSKSLKQNGFKFCGPTICYAFMQAVGMVNDHMSHCYRHGELI